jgi:methylated-DNA-protein-cysteine methyltransferase-like protein
MALSQKQIAGRSARMGYMNAHTIDDVPAHRVVNRKGLLTGKFHFDGTNLMQQLSERKESNKSTLRIFGNQK